VDIGLPCLVARNRLQSLASPSGKRDQGIAKKTCDVSRMLIGLHSVVVDVANLDAAVRDYARLLGGLRAEFEVDPARAIRRAVFRLSNARLELRSPALRTPGAAPDPGEQERPPPAAGGTPFEGIVGLRLVWRAAANTAFEPGALASPTVPVELVEEKDPSSTAPRSESGRFEGAGRIVGLDHIVIATSQPERARRFLGEDLGIRLALDRSFQERGLRLLFFRLGGVTIEVAAKLGPSPSSRVPDEIPDVFHGLAWRVTDLEALHARLATESFDLSPIRAGHKPGSRVCTVRAPVHGVPTLLIEQPPRSRLGATSEG
jgi:catechol 2,3-dioxygenase-like lactoylglutathione lyase family enzyme